MRKSMHATFAVSVAALVLLVGAGTSSASRSISIRGAERGIASAGAVTFGNTPRLEVATLTCDITLLKTLARSIPKVAGTPFGKVTGMAIDRGTLEAPHCARTGAIEIPPNITPLSETNVPGVHRELGRGILLYTVTGSKAGLLWRLIYDGFTGTLPEITGINYHIQGAQIRFDQPIEACLYEGDWFKQIQMTRGVGSRLRIVLARTVLRRIESSAACYPELTVSGELTLTPSITIALL
jgi:hypothetical protein